VDPAVLTTGKKIEMLTDNDISNNANKDKQSSRLLQKMDLEQDTQEMDQDLIMNQNIMWDQFAVNKQKFNVHSDYNFDDYTTKVD